jgi:hypothetical protein
MESQQYPSGQMTANFCTTQHKGLRFCITNTTSRTTLDLRSNSATGSRCPKLCPPKKRLLMPLFAQGIANWCHADGTEVLFTTRFRASKVGGEQFWGRAVRASCDSIESGALLNLGELSTLHWMPLRGREESLDVGEHQVGEDHHVDNRPDHVPTGRVTHQTHQPDQEP